MNNNLVTALLLNWKRPQNIIQTIKSIKEQSVEVDIWLWNNNPEDKTVYDVKYQFNSPNNFVCWPRWLMGSLVNTPYIFTLDDDVKLEDKDVIKDCICYCNNNFNDLIIGFTGVILNKDLNYPKSKHILQPQDKDIIVDIVKGRFMFMKSSLLNNISLEKSDSCEDIKISSYSNNKIIPSILKNRFKNLSEGKEALCAQSEHNKNRLLATYKYFKQMHHYNENIKD